MVCSAPRSTGRKSKGCEARHRLDRAGICRRRRACYFPPVQPKRVRLFIKPWCPWCHRAEEWLRDRGISYERLDVSRDARAWDEMVRLSGQTLAPVIDVDGAVLADFGPEELARFWEGLEARSCEARPGSSR
jgi:glutaredoxin 3